MLLVYPSSIQATEITVFAAGSLTEAIKEIAALYESSTTDSVKVHCNIASSGFLARQISQGADADLFISANPKWMNFLVEKLLVDSQEVQVLVNNSLVFVGNAKNKITDLQEIEKFSRLAMGIPKSVPAGQYAKEALVNSGLFDKIKTKLVMTMDVRQALIYADRGEADGAFVYHTDAILATNAEILFKIPEDLHQPIFYPAALTKTGKKNNTAQAFKLFLFSKQVQEILIKHGFSIPKTRIIK
jgi:molybdate transport system substrate-binding protein